MELPTGTYETNLGLPLLCVLLGACGPDHPSRIETIRANPMAQPTLSFTEVSSQNGSGGSGAGLVGSASAAIHTTVFEIAPDQAQAALDEILEQAEAAGFELDLRSSAERLPSGTHVGSAPDGVEMELIINSGKVLVALR